MRKRPRPHHKVLIVTASMGGGHVQISVELQRRLTERGHDVMLVDLLDLMPALARRFLHWVYPWLVERHPALYQRVYDRFFLSPQRAGERVGLPVRLAMPRLRRVVRAFDPAVVVSTYHLCTLAVGRLRRRCDLRRPAVSVLTQFAVNDLWIHPASDLELCISEPAAADAGRRAGRPAEVCGPIIRPAFLDPQLDRATARARLRLPDDVCVALITTGSIGLAGSAERAARALARLPGWLPVVVCGRAEQLRERLDSLPGVRALGWVDDMPTLMRAADVLVENAAGMSAKEALGAGLPVITFCPLTGHGKDDVAALRQLELTDVVYDEDELATTVEKLVGDSDRYADRVARGKALFAGDPVAVIERLAGSGGQSDSQQAGALGNRDSGAGRHAVPRVG